jgi:hypothetical protein
MVVLGAKSAKQSHVKVSNSCQQWKASAFGGVQMRIPSRAIAATTGAENSANADRGAQARIHVAGLPASQPA